MPLYVTKQLISRLIVWDHYPCLQCEGGDGILFEVNCCLIVIIELPTISLHPLGLPLTQDILVKIDTHSLWATRNNNIISDKPWEVCNVSCQTKTTHHQSRLWGTQTMSSLNWLTWMLHVTLTPRNSCTYFVYVSCTFCVVCLLCINLILTLYSVLINSNTTQ